MLRTFDLVVIGTGVGASPVMSKCRDAGWEVATVDARPYGGTCSLRGCDPKKILTGAAELVDASRRLQDRGVDGELRIQWPALMAFKRSFTVPAPEQREETYQDKGIATFHGRARFVGPTAVQVGDHTLKARHIHIATGARPADVPIAGTEHLTTSDEFLDLDQLPPNIVFMGSGYISFELAHIARTAGAQVTMVEMSDQPLAGFDPELVSLLVKRSRDMGIELLTRTRVEAVEPRAGDLLVRASVDGQTRTFRSNIVVHGAGRVPDIDDLDLAKAGIEHDERGIIVNSYMQSTTNPAIYAAGDVATVVGTNNPQLTPVASLEAQVAAANLLEGNTREIEYPPIPRVAFTIPPIASVGLHEAKARAEGLRFAVHHRQTRDWYSSQRIAEQCSGYKVLVEEGSQRILGAHLVGPRADELINVFTMAMCAGITAGDIEDIIFTYPTHASDMESMLAGD